MSMPWTPRRTWRLALGISLLALCAGCTVGPDYVRPSVSTPPAFKEAGAIGSRATTRIESRWWAMYGDPVLDGLVAKVALNNQSLKAAAARVQEAQALLQSVSGERDPSVTIGTFTSGRSNNKDFGPFVGWEVDLWGRIRRNIQAHAASAQASADDLAAATLSMRAQVVQAYFDLRTQTALIKLQQGALKVDRNWARMVTNQHAAGVASADELAQADARLGATQTRLLDTELAQAKITHALAVMVGMPPADFSIAAAPLHAQVPTIPASLPSQLLQRRPDIAAAERRVAAASATIGVRVAERYPSLNLAAGIGVLGGLAGAVDFKAPIFAGGQLRANVRHARAAYTEAIANYRQTVLTAFREVEDNLAAQRLLAQSRPTQVRAAASAEKVRAATHNQYAAGVTSYQAVVEAQANALDQRSAALTLLHRRLDASVNLIKALGGGWSVTPPAGKAGQPDRAVTATGHPPVSASHP